MVSREYTVNFYAITNFILDFNYKRWISKVVAAKKHQQPSPSHSHSIHLPKSCGLPFKQATALTLFWVISRLGQLESCSWRLSSPSHIHIPEMDLNKLTIPSQSSVAVAMRNSHHRTTHKIYKTAAARRRKWARSTARRTRPTRSSPRRCSSTWIAPCHRTWSTRPKIVISVSQIAVNFFTRNLSLNFRLS